MYDPIRSVYRFRCPRADRDVDVPLSAFRAVERLPGPEHPAVHRVTYRCGRCGVDHPTLASERELDCAPVSPAGTVVFRNLLTGRTEPVTGEWQDAAQRHLARGRWPWTFFCAEEHRARPGYPSRLVMLAPSADRGLVGVAVTCSTCARVSVNLVSRRHLDEPFFHDPVLRYVDRVFDGALDSFERFRRDLWSSRFDDERNDLSA